MILFKLNKSNSQAGFSLIESLIALAMLSIALSWLSNIFLQQRLATLKNESITGSVKVAQTILDNIRQRNILKTPYEGYTPTDGPRQQICNRNTTVTQDPNYLCPGNGVQPNSEEELKQTFGEYYEAIITFCPYQNDSTAPESKKCTQDSRYIKIEVLDLRRRGADAEKYVTESFFTRFRE